MPTRIKELRVEQGLTRKELAVKANISERQIIRIEKGEQSPTLITLSAIAKVLETTISYLVYESNKKDIEQLFAVVDDMQNPQ